jgi:fructose-specific component phosphotransferase system IIB-like protein
MISATNRRNSKNKVDQQQQRVEFNSIPTNATITTKSTPIFDMKKASSQPQMYGTNATFNDATSAATTIGHVIPLSTQVSNLTLSSEEENSEPLNILDRYL